MNDKELVNFLESEPSELFYMTQDGYHPKYYRESKDRGFLIPHGSRQGFRITNKGKDFIKVYHMPQPGKSIVKIWFWIKNHISFKIGPLTLK